MGIAVLIVVCTAGDVFLVYALIQFLAESKRTPRRGKTGAAAFIFTLPREIGFDLIAPLSTATWIDGTWERSAGSLLPMSRTAASQEVKRRV